MNYAVFSVFTALLLTEIMGSLLLLLRFDQARRNVLDYTIPIWEVTGTFGAFWVVTGDFAYPTLLIPVAAIFAPLLTIFLVLFVARNASISFAEFVTKRGRLDEATLFRGYALSTVVLGLTALVLLSALVGGQGVDLTAGSFSLVSWATPGSLVFLVGALLICLGLAPAFFGVSTLRGAILPFAGLGVAASVFSYWLMSPSLLSWWLSLPVALTLGGVLLCLWPRSSRILANKAIFIFLLAIIVFSLQSLVYPNAIGRALPVDAVTTGGAMGGAYFTITAAGAVLLALMLTLYVVVAKRGPGGPDQGS